MTQSLSQVVPIEGQSFSSEQDWINRATRCLTSHPEYRNTEHGENRGWRGPHFTALCFDQAGNRMRNGGDFQRATREGTYPVWWIWPDQIVNAIAAPAPDPDTLSEAVGLLRRVDEDLLGDNWKRDVRAFLNASTRAEGGE